MDALQRLLEKEKRKLRPAKSKKAFEAIRKKINDSIRRSKIGAEAVFGGSIAKGTNIKGDFDCDIFVKFQMSYREKDISTITERILSGFKPERIHGSRDYFQFKVKKMRYEVVPVLDIKDTSEIVNTTDASPLHAEWVRKEIEKEPSLADEIRLTKQFCKAQGVYGAESYIRGFSGHVVDILTIDYRGFLNLLRGAAKWKDKTIIDYYDVHKGRALENLNASKTESPLILIDPMEQGRNAAASLSPEKFERFIDSARGFLKRPRASYFRKKKLSLIELKRKAKGKRLLIIEAFSLDGKEDIVGSKMLKAFEYMKTQLSINDFPIHDSGWEWDRKRKALFWIISESILSEKEWMGPPLGEKTAVKSFKEKHGATFEMKGRVYAKVQRKSTEPRDFLKTILLHEQVRGRVRKVALK